MFSLPKGVPAPFTHPPGRSQPRRPSCHTVCHEGGSHLSLSERGVAFARGPGPTCLQTSRRLSPLLSATPLDSKAPSAPDVGRLSDPPGRPLLVSAREGRWPCRAEPMPASTVSNERERLSPPASERRQTPDLRVHMRAREGYKGYTREDGVSVRLI